MALPRPASALTPVHTAGRTLIGCFVSANFGTMEFGSPIFWLLMNVTFFLSFVAGNGFFLGGGAGGGGDYCTATCLVVQACSSSYPRPHVHILCRLAPLATSTAIWKDNKGQRKKVVRTISPKDCMPPHCCICIPGRACVERLVDSIAATCPPTPLIQPAPQPPWGTAGSRTIHSIQFNSMHSEQYLCCRWYFGAC